MESIQTTLPAPRGLAIRLFHRLLSPLGSGQLVVEIGDQGFSVRGGSRGPAAHLRILRPWRVLRRLLLRGDVGFGESFVAGDIETDDLRSLLLLLAINEEHLTANFRGAPLSRLLGRILNTINDNSRRGSRRNIAVHYDLGNDFYAQWLDQSMAYSAGCFAQSRRPLRASQMLKFERMLQLTGAQPGDRILEIGCGWGGFAIHAASQGMHVTAITLSSEQFAFAQRRVAALGLEKRIDLRLCDYRDIGGSFDHIVSIEMFEAVGERHWPTFMQRIGELLKPGGHAALQVITIDDQWFPAYRKRADFIQRYVFPGGMLPSPSAFAAVASDAGLEQRETTFDADDYARTIAAWRENFVAAMQRGRLADRDPRFLRLWDYYLCLCEAGFRVGTVDLMRTVLTRP